MHIQLPEDSGKQPRQPIPKGQTSKGKKVNSSEPYPNPLLCPSGVLANSQFEHRIQGESSGLEPVAVLLDWRNKNRS